MFWGLIRKINFFMKDSIFPVNVLSENILSGKDIGPMAQWVMVLADPQDPQNGGEKPFLLLLVRRCSGELHTYAMICMHEHPHTK